MILGEGLEATMKSLYTWRKNSEKLSTHYQKGLPNNDRHGSDLKKIHCLKLAKRSFGTWFL